MALEDFSEYTDADLWKLVRCNNIRAFDQIYLRYWSKIYYAAHKALKDHESSSDITQEIFASLWIKRETILIASLPSYLYGMVRNQIFKHLRNGNISRTHLERINQIADVNHTEQAVNFNQLQEMYSKSLAVLPERCQEIFKLSRNENFSNKEIARHLDISPKTVEHQISKALKFLRLALKETVLLIVLFCS